MRGNECDASLSAVNGGGGGIENVTGSVETSL